MPRSSHRTTRDDWELWLGLLGFVFEYPFKGLNGKRRWRFDYAIPRCLIAVEYEGMSDASGEGLGRHRTISGMEGDMQKYNEAALAGWLVIRCNRTSIADGDCHGYVEQAMEFRDCRREESSVPPGTGCNNPSDVS